jgi:DNA-3-methyladenine glycosylase
VARELLGAIVVSTAAGGRVVAAIVETEAYLGRDDPASHAYRGRRHPGNEAIYSAPGHWYVYRSYGMHWCANLVAGPKGAGAAVLLRAVTVLEGLDLVRVRRGDRHPLRLTDGPGKLCAALAIDKQLDGRLMRRSNVTVHPPLGAVAIGRIETTPRIGITKAADWLLRFVAVAEKEAGGSSRNRPPGTAVDKGQ